MRRAATLLPALLAGCIDAQAGAVRALPTTPPARPVLHGEVALADPVAPPPRAREMLPGMAVLGSSFYPEVPATWAGHGRSTGPLPLAGELLPGLHLLVDADARATWGPYAGVRVVLVNGGPEIEALPAQDGRLDLVQQALLNGEWVAIEHLPQSWCGNSYHSIEVPNQHGVPLDLPRYDGPQRVLLRAALVSEGPPVVSQSWWGGITDGQRTGVAGAGHLRTLTDPRGW